MDMPMKKTIPLLALLTAVTFFVNGCIVINVEKKESPEKSSDSSNTKEITVESN